MDERIVTPFDPITSPYADIFNSLERSRRHVFMHQLEQGILPYLRVAGESEWLGLPLTSHQAAAVQAKFPASIVPRDAITVDNSAWDDMFAWDSTPASFMDLSSCIENHLGLAYAHNMHRFCNFELSHLVIDTTGDASLWRPQQPPPGTYGSVIILLPSYVEGGDFSFAYGSRVEKWHGTHAPWSALPFAAFYNSTAMHMTPILSGRVVGLVYNLVGDVSTPVVAPSLPVAAIDALSALATPTSPMLGLRVYLSKNMTLGHLARGEVAWLAALQATDAYDVVLAGLRDHKNGMKEVSNGVPCSRMPAFVAKKFEKGLPSFPLRLLHERPDHEDPLVKHVLLFWPKVARLHHFDLDDAIQGAHDDFFFYGLDDERAKLDTFLTIATHRVVGGATLTALGTRLTALGDLDLVQRFLTMAHQGRIDLEWMRAIAPSIALWLDRFGSIELGASLMALMTALRASSVARVAGFSLLVSLAGATTTPICNAVPQPFMRDLVFACADRLATDAAMCCDKLDDLVVGLRRAIELDAYLSSTPPESSSWLAHRVPATVACGIEAFLRPPPFRHEFVTSTYAIQEDVHTTEDGQVDKMTVVSFVVTAIAPLVAQEHLHAYLEPYLTMTKASCDGTPFARWALSSTRITAALVVLHHLRALTSDVVPSFRRAFRRNMVSAIRAFLAATPDRTQDETLVLATLLDNPTIGGDLSFDEVYLLDALTLLHDLAPARAISWIRSQLETHPNIDKAMQDAVYPLLLHSRDALPRHLVELLVDACLDCFRRTLGAAHPIEALRLPACCRWCAEFDAFLQSSSQYRFVAEWTETDPVCPKIEAFVEAHSHLAHSQAGRDRGGVSFWSMATHHYVISLWDPQTTVEPSMVANLEAWRLAALPTAKKRKFGAIEA